MSKFILKMCLLFLVCTCLIGVGCYYQKDDVLCITDSSSMDFKLYDIHQKDIENVDVASFGASINLNSINSKIFLDDLHIITVDGRDAYGRDLSYYNFANWGIRVKAMRNMLDCILQRSNPRMVVMVGTPVDFYDDSFYEDLDWGIIKHYMDGNPFTDIPAYLKGGYPYNKGYMEKYIRYTTQNQDKYENMEMDEWGGSYMNVCGDDISADRWNDILHVEDVEEYQWKAFEEMVSYLDDQNITFVYVLAPYRAHFAEDETAKKFMTSFDSRMKTLCDYYGQHYYNAVDFNKYTDEYFSDCTHLNKAGAELFTKDMTAWMNTNVILRR